MHRKETIFDETLRAHRLGGKYPHEALPDGRTKTFYQDLIQTTKDLLLSSDPNLPWLRNKPDLFVGIADCTLVNACAFRYEDTHYIAISRGVFELLPEVFQRLLSRPEVFPWLGDMPEGRKGTALPPMRRDSSSLTDTTIPPDGTVLTRRDLAAAWMAATAMAFLIRHEICHIIAGHVDYANFRFNSSFMLEAVSSGGSRDKNFIYHSFEHHADSFAAVTLLGQHLRPTDAWGGITPPFLEGYDDRPAKLLNLTLAAIMGVLRIFGTSLVDYDRWLDFDHPPDEVRRMSIAANAQLHLPKWGHEKLANDPHAISDCIEAVDVHLREIFGDAPLTEEWLREFLSGGKFHEYSAKLHSTLYSLAPQLEKFAFRPILRN